MIQFPLLDPVQSSVSANLRAAPVPVESQGAIDAPRFGDSLAARSREPAFQARDDQGSVDGRRQRGSFEPEPTDAKRSRERVDQDEPALDEDLAAEDAEGVMAPVETERRVNDAPIDDDADQGGEKRGDSPAIARLSARVALEHAESARSADQARPASAPNESPEGADHADGAELKQGTGVASLEPGDVAQIAVEEPIVIASPAHESKQGVSSDNRPAETSHQTTQSRLGGEPAEAARLATTGERFTHDEGGERRREDQSLGSGARLSEPSGAPKEARAEAVFQIERLAEAGSVKSEGPANPILAARSERSELSPAPTQAHGVDGRLVAQSVGRGLSAALQQGTGDVLIRLTPPSLGLVRVQMTLDHGAVSVRLETTTQAAQQILGDQLGALRQSLEARGLSVERIGLQHAPLATASNSHGAQHQSQHQQGPSSGQQQDLSGDQDAGGAPSKGRQDGQQDREADSGGLHREESSFESAFNESVSFHLEATA